MGEKKKDKNQKRKTPQNSKTKISIQKKAGKEGTRGHKQLR